jgi:hypothetical protein
MGHENHSHLRLKDDNLIVKSCPLGTNLLEIKGIPLNKVEVIQAFFSINI